MRSVCAPFATYLRPSPPFLSANLFTARRLFPIQVRNNGSNSEANKLVDELDFGSLCNEFECVSSPLVESSARQLVRDILELRESNRAFEIYAVSVKYKDPLRSFTGRDKYRRPLWTTHALDRPFVSVEEMAMLSTSVLNIKFTIRGKPNNPLVSILSSGKLIIKVDSKFTFNQISGQVIEHHESWDLTHSSPIGQAYFCASRALFEAAKDAADSANTFTATFSTPKDNNSDIYLDPTKFFQRDDDFQRDFYQIALLLALVYFVVQFLRTTL